MGISFDEVQHVARLARLELDQVELLAFQAELNALLGHFQDLNEVDVANVDPKPHAVVLLNVLADDIPGGSLARDRVLANAAISRAGLFIVPTVIEE